MATRSIEERLDILEKRNALLEEKNKEFEHEIQRLQAINEIQNVINKFEWRCEAGQWEKVVELFAHKTPGVRSEILNWGVYEGIESLKRLYITIHAIDTSGSEDNPSMAPGILLVNTSTTQVIEIAGDGKTAKGVWISPGLETTPVRGTSIEEGKFQAYWVWCKLAVDFVKEDSQWKIWHYHVYGLFDTPFEKSWVEPIDWLPLIERPKTLPDELKADRPTTHPVWWYSKDASTDPVPVPPEPYETFEEATAY